MADTASTTGANGTEGETPTQLQARLRREKRAKKMAEQGEDRLAKIKALNGGVAPPEEVLGGPTPVVTRNATVADDPDEVDISQASNVTSSARNNDNTTQAQQNDFVAAMQQMQQKQGGAGNGGADDPMMRMMQQMMGGMGGQAQDPNNPDANQQLPQMLQALMKGGQQQQPQEAPSSSSTYVWRIVHAVFAISLAAYVAFTSTFDGNRILRTQDVYTEGGEQDFGRLLIILFTSGELVLQSSRFFLEKGQLQGPGLFAKVANSGFLSAQYAGYVHTLGRYVSIAQTIFGDVMVLVFIFGFAAWWKGTAAA